MLRDPLLYESADRVYLVGPVAPATPSGAEIEEFAFGASVVEQLRRGAPNPHLTWYSGHYVEADIPNGNGAMWTGQELAIKSLTPMLCPVTVHHDPRTAVGLIADARLRTPTADQVPRAKIETALALWSHRFPEVVEEANLNYASGTLYQSMEALAPTYNCASCGMSFAKLPQGAERANWCAHLNGEAGVQGVRILRDVTFTGTGLIFGSRGARGADPSANLEAFQQEVAEFHQRVHHDAPHRPRRKRTMETVEIAKQEYDELRARPAPADVEAERARAEKAERELEQAETAQRAAESERDELKAKVSGFEEQARQVTLRDERLDRLGAGFTAKLGEKTTLRLRGQAAALPDDDWTARLDELEELTGAKRDDGATSTAGAGPTFTHEEIARHNGGLSAAPGTRDQSPNQRRSVLAGLSAPRR